MKAASQTTHTFRGGFCPMEGSAARRLYQESLISLYPDLEKRAAYQPSKAGRIHAVFG